MRYELAIVAAKPREEYRLDGCHSLTRPSRNMNEEDTAILDIVDACGLPLSRMVLTHMQKCAGYKHRLVALNACIERYLSREVKVPCPVWLVLNKGIYMDKFKKMIKGKFIGREIINEFFTTDRYEDRFYIFALPPSHVKVKNRLDEWKRAIADEIRTRLRETRGRGLARRQS